MKNSADLGGCYPPQPSASVDNTLLDLQNSSYPTRPHSIIAKYVVFGIIITFELFNLIDYSINTKLLTHQLEQLLIERPLQL